MPDVRFCTAPIAIRATAAINASGTRTRTVVRTRSAQKLPSRSVRDLVKPRISATATEMPTAAETKFWTARPAICVRWPMVASPE